MTTLVSVAALYAIFLIPGSARAVAALCFGMRVDRFSIGIGPPLWSRTLGATTLQLNMVPIGTFVQIAGLHATGKLLATDDARAFHNRPLSARMCTVLAGTIA